MADLAQIAIAIVADPSGFEQALLSAQKSAQRFGDMVGNAMQSIEASMNAVAANPIGAAFLAAVRTAQFLQSAVSGVRDEFRAMLADGMRAGAEQHRFMERLGLDARAAGGLMLLGRQSGMDTGGLQASLQMMQLRLGEAARTGGTADSALRAIGLSARELTALPVDQQLQRISAAMAGVGTQAQRSELMMQIFGRRGRELQTIINRGGDAFEQASRQAEAWGLTLSKADEAAIRRAQLAQNEAETASGSVYQGIANSLTSSMAPAIEAANKFVTQFIDLAQGPLSEVRAGIRAIGEAVMSVWSGFSQVWETTLPFVSAMFNEVKKSIKEVGDLLGGSGDMLQMIGKAAAMIAVGGIWLITVGVKMIVSYIQLAVGAWELFGGGVRSVIGLFQALERWRTGGDTPTTKFVFTEAKAAAQAAAEAQQALNRDAEEYEKILRRIVIAKALAVAIQDGEIRGQHEMAILQAQAEGNIGAETAAKLMNVARFVDMMEAAHKLIMEIRPAWEQAGASADYYRQMLAKGLLTQQQFSDAMARLHHIELLPLDRFQREFTELQREFYKAELTAEQFAQATTTAWQRAAQAAGSTHVQLAAGITAGSAASISLLNQAIVNQPQDVQTRIAATIDVLKQQAILQTQIQQETLRYFQNRGNAPPASVV